MKKVIVLLLLGVGALFAYKVFFSGGNTSAGELAPDINATLINGEDFNLSDLRGNYVLLDFWGSWCAPCRKENPKLKSLYETYAGKSFKDADSFEIVSIALERNDKNTRRIIEQDGLNWKYHVISESRIVMLSPYAQKFGVTELPSKFLINPDGAFMGTDLPFSEIERILDARLQ